MTQSVDEIMGFDPRDLSSFQEPVNTGNGSRRQENPNIYRTNPNAMEEDADGNLVKVVKSGTNYCSKVRVIYNPFNPKRSIVNQTTYALKDEAGTFVVRSASADNQDCPIMKAFLETWGRKTDPNSEARHQFAQDHFDRTQSRWVLVQIIEDDNRPELVGQFKAMKLPTKIYNKMAAKMNPAPETKKEPVALLDYLVGPVLSLNVAPGPDDAEHPERKNREINYDLSDFETDATPIIQINGEPLFTDEEMELIEKYVDTRAEIVKMQAKVTDAEAKGKTDAKSTEKLNAAKAELEAIREDVRKLYVKAQ